MNAYLFASEIYRLLAELDSVTLRELDSLELPPEIADIVGRFRAAKFSRKLLPESADLSSLPKIDQPQIQASYVPIGAPSRELVVGADMDVLNSIVHNYSEHLTNEHLVALLGRAGMEIAPRAKESRDSLVQRMKRAFMEMRGEKRDRVLKNFIRLAQIGETEGWMRVIQRRKE